MESLTYVCAQLCEKHGQQRGLVTANDAGNQSRVIVNLTSAGTNEGRGVRTGSKVKHVQNDASYTEKLIFIKLNTSNNNSTALASSVFLYLSWFRHSPWRQVRRSQGQAMDAIV